MFYPQKNPYRKPIADNLILRTVETEDDVKRLSALNGEVHSEGEIALTELLIKDHPSTHPHHWLMVCTEDSDQVVSTLCLIPWTFFYGKTPIKSAELGIVGTKKEFRKRGLQRELVARHRELMQGEEFILSHIQGIGFFYRQFGYDYAVPLQQHINIGLHTTGEVLDKALKKPVSEFTVRSATEIDIPHLNRFYQKSTEILDLYAGRDEETWRYILGPSLRTGTAADTYIVESTAHEPVGYFRIAREGFGKGIIVEEVSEMRRDVYPWVFKRIYDLALEREKPYIRCNLSEVNGAAVWVLDNGGKNNGHYRWQMNIPNAARFLRSIRPELDRRLSSSDFADYSGTLTINLFKEQASVVIENGAVASISDQNAKLAERVHLPPNLFPMCALGDRTISECHEFYPDANAEPFAERLFGNLFPRMNSFLHELY